MYIDLHCHSTESDGFLTPEQLIKKAAGQGKINILSITDHDHFTNEFDSLYRYAESLGVRLIPGVEVSTTWISPTGIPHTVHIVALAFDPTDIHELLKRNKPDRRPYLNKILHKLKSHGIDLGNLNDLYPEDSTDFYGRMHIAQEMVARQHVQSIEEAFEEFIGSHGKKKCYVPCDLTFLPMQEVLQVLSGHAACVLCHLYYYNLSEDDNLALLKDFKTYGGIGIETEYARYTREQRNKLEAYRKQFGLVSSCASDYHGQDPTEHLCHHFPVDKCKDLLDYIDAIRIRKDSK